tara:strand:- start:1013 stop:2737 length:1725 start_codon:yes stop_codon:yes gene_type:complete
MATYTRQSTFTDGDTIYASLLNNEYDQLVAAFHVSSGHTHDGTTTGDGGPISKLYSNTLTFGTNANTDIAVTFNATTNDGVLTWMEDEDYFKFSDDILVDSAEKVLFRDSAIYIHSSTDGQLDLVADTEIQIAATTVDLNGNLDVSGTLKIGSGATVSTILDEDDFATNSDTALATQQSVKAYVDAQVATVPTGDITAVTAGTGLSGGGTTGAVTLDIDATVATLTGSQVLASKTLTSPVLNTGVSGTAVLDEDNMASDSNTQLATQQSIKAYVDTQVATVPTGDITAVVAGTGLSGGATSGSATLNIDTATTADLTTSQTLTNKILTSPVINTGISGTAILDEDDFASDSDTQLATQQSIKAYVATQVATANELSELTDTNITSPADASLLFYDTSTSKWIDNVVSGDITIADTGVATIATGAVDNAMLSGSIANNKLANDSVSFGGVSVDLGASDSTPAFDLTDATNYPTSSLVGTITNTQLAGSIAASKLAGSIGDSLLSTISTAGKVDLAALEIDGGTDIGADLTTSDLIIVDDGAGGTNRKAALSRLTTFMTGQGFSTEDPTALAIALG